MRPFNRRVHFLGAGFCLIGLACGTHVQFGDPGSGGAGSSTSTSTSNSTSTSTSTSGSGSGGGICDGFEDQTGLGSVSVWVKNETAQAIFVPTACGRPLVQIESFNDGPELSYNYDTHCLATCEKLQENEHPVCTAAACAETVMVVPPGERRSIPWDGTGLMERTMPQACWYGESAQGRCAQIVAAEAGPYAVRVSAYDACTGPCVCDGDECLGGVGGAEAKSEPVTLKFPEQGEVEVVFEACAFGCPEETP